VFKLESTPVGAQMVMLPTVSADGRFVRLAVKTRISTAAPTQPAGYRVTIAAEDDPDGESARTETVRRPAVNVQQSDATVSFPVGRTLLLHLGASSPDEHPLIVMLTPTVIATPPVACPPPPVPCPAFAAQPAPVVEEQAAPPADTKLAKLLAKYRQACSAGDAAKARKLADRCLAIDPTCFGK
jgi:hypothetical protein